MNMKKAIIAISSILVLSLVIVFIVSAQDGSKSNKKAKTEVTSTPKCCQSATATAGSQGCCGQTAKGDSTKCKMSENNKGGNMSCCKQGEKTGSMKNCPVKTSTQGK